MEETVCRKDHRIGTDPRRGDKPALIRDDMLKECTASCNPNPFGIIVGPGFIMVTLEAMEHQYREIRKIFFAGFDTNEEWKLIPGYSHIYLAGVNYDAKVIMYSCDLTNMPISTLNRVLIHELCHAELGPRGGGAGTGITGGHGKRWRTRMEKVAQGAEAIGDEDLAQELREDRDLYDPDSDFYEPPLDAITCYEAIRQLVRENPQDWSFEDVMYWIGRDFYEPHDQLIKKFKKCRQVFEKAMKQVKHVASVRNAT